MFAVLYQSYINAGHEEEYQALWHKIARYFIEERGALGSCLHKTQEGMWIAYSRWPDKETRDASWPSGSTAPSNTLPKDIIDAIYALKECSDQGRKLPEICMEVIDDLLLHK